MRAVAYEKQKVDKVKKFLPVEKSVDERLFGLHDALKCVDYPGAMFYFLNILIVCTV
jgi:hypothetical protein